jgi:hypothetical protein
LIRHDDAAKGDVTVTSIRFSSMWLPEMRRAFSSAAGWPTTGTRPRGENGVQGGVADLVAAGSAMA